jgi:MerR family mercuric resistance operon transcriptional regulator
MATLITIGRLASAADVNVETIRYYQRRRLLEKPSRPEGGFRLYSPDAVRRVRFIKRAQALGFTLDEVGRLLLLEDTRECRKARDIAADKLKKINEKLADLSAIRNVLAKLIKKCDSGYKPGVCPIINALAARGDGK